MSVTSNLVVSVTDDFEAKLIATVTVSTQHVSDMQARLGPRDLSQIYTLVARVSQTSREYKKLQL